MFDDNQNPQSNIPAAPGADKPIQSPPVDEKPVSPDVIKPLAADEKPKEPEDIFGDTDRIKSPADKQLSSDSAAVSSPISPVSPDSAAAEESAEPTIKTPPSVFTKKIGQEPFKSEIPKQPVSMPPIDGSKSLTKKNLIILITVILIAAGIGFASWWWFTQRSQTGNGQPSSPAILNLFDKNKISEDDSLTDDDDNGTHSSDIETPAPPADTDGDGLTDEEEIILGTSLNSPDTDNDGLYDREEVKIYHTDPLRADTDNDGWKDGDEVQKNQDPLTPDPGPEPSNKYTDIPYKFQFTYPEDMVFESLTDNIIQFNDNVNHIKLYIYAKGSQPISLISDISYQISEQTSGQLTIESSQTHSDSTPYSTDYATQVYTSHNGLTYLIRYLATKRADNHQEKFEQILQTFKFLN